MFKENRKPDKKPSESYEEDRKKFTSLKKKKSKKGLTNREEQEFEDLESDFVG